MRSRLSLCAYTIFRTIVVTASLVAAFLSLGGVESNEATAPVSAPMTLLLKTESSTLTVTLLDNPTAHDLWAQLPLTLDLSDYAGTEKIATLSRKLSTRDAPQGSDPEVGTLAYYAPWGNLAFFYKDFGYSRGLIALGAVNAGDITTLARLPNGKVTIERVAMAFSEQ